MDNENNNVLIIGAGPSGLALAYELIKLNSKYKPVIIDKLSQVGGLSRTVYDGNYGIDIGGHRLFTKDKYVENIWKNFLKPQNAPSVDDIVTRRKIKYPKEGLDPSFEDDVLLIRKRFSSILKNGKKFKYPLNLGFDTLLKLNPLKYLYAFFSLLKAKIIRRYGYSVEDFLINKFGLYLYNMFFKEHSKKVWGVDNSQLIHKWGRERIQNSIFLQPFLPRDKFYYPKYGCSQLWDKMAQFIIDNGGDIILNCEFIDFNIKNRKIVCANVRLNEKNIQIPAKYYASSVPLADLIKTLDVPFDIKQNALNLPYRDYILVSLFTRNFNLKNDTNFETVNNITPDNWIYLQQEGTVASRMQIMNNWSPYLVHDFKDNYLISLEYFCCENDDIWNMKDNELAKLAISECEKYKFFTKDDVFKINIIREKKAYPVYSGSYKNIDKIKEYINKYSNLYLMGRNGEHNYINMDYAMVCGINIARDINKG